jgi:hypothetical protein
MSDLPKCPCGLVQRHEPIGNRKRLWDCLSRDWGWFKDGEHCPICGAPLREDGAGPSYAEVEKALELAASQIEDGCGECPMSYLDEEPLRADGRFSNEDCENCEAHTPMQCWRDWLILKATEALA